MKVKKLAYLLTKMENKYGGRNKLSNKSKLQKTVIINSIVFLLHLLLAFLVAFHDGEIINAWKYTKMYVFVLLTFTLFVSVFYIKKNTISICWQSFLIILYALISFAIKGEDNITSIYVYITGGVLYLTLANIYKDKKEFISYVYVSFLFLYIYLLVYCLINIAKYKFPLESSLLTETTANTGILSILLTAVFIFVFEFTFNIYTKSILLKKILILSLPFFVISTIALNNRTVIVALILAFILPQFKTYINKRRIIIPLFFIVIVFVMLYLMRPDSLNGRLLIWRISLDILKDNFIFGIGLDGFRSTYPLYQMSFLSKLAIDDSRNLLAGNIGYTFNEPLQFIIEFGFIGLMVILFTIYSLFKKCNIQNIEKAAYRTLLFLCISSFSYFTFHSIPIIIIAIICISILTHSKFQYTLSPRYQTIILIIIGGVLFTYHNQYSTLKKLSNIHCLPMNKHDQLVMYNKCNVDKTPELMINLAYIQYKLGLYKEAIKTTHKILKFVKTDRQYVFLSNCYYNLENNDSANYYLQKAIKLVPGNIENRYQLYLNYELQKDSTKMAQCAKEIKRTPLKFRNEKGVKIKKIINEKEYD